MDAPLDNDDEVTKFQGCVYPLAPKSFLYRSLALSWLNLFVIFLSGSVIVLWLLPEKPDLQVMALAIPAGSFLAATMMHIKDVFEVYRANSIAIKDAQLYAPLRFRNRIDLRKVAAIESDDEAIYIRPINGFTRTLNKSSVENETCFEALKSTIKEQLDSAGQLRANETAMLAKLQRATPKTSTLLVSGLLFLYLFVPNNALIEAAALDRPLIWTGEIYRLITYSIVHMDTVHLLTNCISIAMLGYILEGILGKPRYLAVFVFGVLGGGLLTFIFGEQDYFTVGASGGAFGLLGSGVYLVLDKRFTLPPKTFRVPSQVTVILAALVLLPIIPGTDGIAHIGGFLAGFAATWFLLAGIQVPKNLDVLDLKAAVTSSVAFLIFYVPSVALALLTV
ncbi:MAG: rhomboid family intramembrane serine protease [Gammaproteobacteria bacterium]|nr:rhomboid family intramembrane serine protease [Gammaproteobacteria bacterium]